MALVTIMITPHLLDYQARLAQAITRDNPILGPILAPALEGWVEEFSKCRGVEVEEGISGPGFMKICLEESLLCALSLAEDDKTMPRSFRKALGRAVKEAQRAHLKI